MHFATVVLLLSSLALGAAAGPVAPASGISSQSLIPRDEAEPHAAMIYVRASKSKGKSSSSDGNSTDTTTNSASGPVMAGGYAPLVLGMAVLGLNVL
ncbi:hypothetical protein MMC31_004696 [Peltigera leucophlebia]|nr:hypothetical protein [Peltigera leucophlebia]